MKRLERLATFPLPSAWFHASLYRPFQRRGGHTIQVTPD